MVVSAPIKVVASHDTGLVKMFFDGVVSRYTMTPDGALALAEALGKAAQEARTAQPAGASVEENEAEEYLDEVFDDLKHEEKMAHGGD